MRGSVCVPGDKSISHRALILGALRDEPLQVRGINPGRDVAATADALRAIGARVDCDGDDATVRGGALHDPAGIVDCMNSGSTARMLMGVCAGAGLAATLDGDDSLRKRPMEPVAAHLRAYGARIETRGGTLPATVRGTNQPETRMFILVTPSAQIKTALLFAAAFGRVAIEIRADRGSRDHTERMLRHLGASIEFDGATVRLRSGPATVDPIDVPGDFSAAAFFIVAATVTPGSSITLPGVGVNPTRTGLLDVLQAMGARIALTNRRELGGEPVADLHVEAAELHATTVESDVTLRAIDEIPVLAVAAAFAQGVTRMTGVADLRNKESDRVAAIERLLGVAEVTVETIPNGIAIHGGDPRANGAAVEVRGDHRTAMAAAALAASAGPVAIDDAECVAVSFPGFAQAFELVQNTLRRKR